MPHAIYRVLSFEIIGPHELRVGFDDGVARDIDFQPILKGPMFGPLTDLSLFNAVQLDDEVHTLVWPNGADFDPETLHNWPELIDSLAKSASRWEPDTAFSTLSSRGA